MNPNTRLSSPLLVRTIVLGVLMPLLVPAGENSGDTTSDGDPLRPQFHYTAEKGFLSDPNGLVYYQGEYHLFYQTNPNDCISGVPQHWGHAISPDLVHWVRQPIAIYPHDGGNIWSGSAVVDWQNSSGLQIGAEPPLVAFYTWAKDFSQRLIYSNDHGRSWKEYDRNPVLPNIAGGNRDPKLFWHEPTKRWVMLLFVKEFDLFTSTNLRDWTPCSTIPKPAMECPDMFELAVDGNPGSRKWVVVGGDGSYHLGRFDGTTFTKESGPHRSCYGLPGLFYATQTWSDIPAEDGRRIQIACLRSDHGRKDRKSPDPGMAFCNEMTFPCELTLRTTEDGVRLFREPVREIARLYAGHQTWKSQKVQPAARFDFPAGELFDLTVSIQPYDAARVTLGLRGITIEYQSGKRDLVCEGQHLPVIPAKDGTITLRILRDRTSLELFANTGQRAFAVKFKPLPNADSCYIATEGGTAEVETLDLHKLKSIWDSK